MTRRGFRLDAELTGGRLAIEASAGTGKTYTLSTLAARYVAEWDVAASELLIVTFTRAAAAELGDRVRARMVDLLAALDGDDPPDDPALATLWNGPRAAYRDRLATAVTEFDTATITTIHGFAQQVLGTLGRTAPTDPDAALVDDTCELSRQVVTDLLVATLADPTAGPVVAASPQDLVNELVRVLNNPDALLVPGVDHPDPAVAGHRRFIDTALHQVHERRRRAGTLAFTDLLVGLRNALIDPAGGRTAIESLRNRYRVVLIDEFQDTDPVQWDIFDLAFGDISDREPSRRCLAIVGDPKQAIYAFRGANVHTYLQAAHHENATLSDLGVNWRSDASLLSATESLLTGVTFGDDDIHFLPVSPSPDASDRRIRRRDGGPLAPLSLRLVDGPEVKRSSARTKSPVKPAVVAEAERVVYPDVARYVRDLLEQAEIPDGRGDRRSVEPGDVAVLVASHREAPPVRDSFLALGIPAVIARGDAVVDTEAATQWRLLLHALARPSDPTRARGAALSWFFGWDAPTLMSAADDDLLAIQEQLTAWAREVAEHGVASFVGRVRAESGVAERVLSRPDGARAMTDLDHLAELLCLTAARATSAQTLLDAFDGLGAAEQAADPDADLAARRIESEASAVQIMTMHVSKGLEFPVVCCPSLWKSTPARPSGRVWWDDDAHRRVIDVMPDEPWEGEPAPDERSRRAVEEAIGENLRLLYVAFTRARHHTVVWWLPTKDAAITGLARVLFARTEAGDIDPGQFHAAKVDATIGPDAHAKLAPVVERSDGTLSVTVVDPGDDRRRWRGGPAPDEPPLHTAALARTLDRRAGRWSFTTITSRAGHGDRGWEPSGAPAVVDPTDPSAGDAGAGDEPGFGSGFGSGDGSGFGSGDGPGFGSGDGPPEGFRGEPAAGQRVKPPAESAATAPHVSAGPAGASRGDLPLGAVPGGTRFGNLVHKVLEAADFTATDLTGELLAKVTELLPWYPWPVDPDALAAGLAATLATPLGTLFDNRRLCDLARRDRLDELEFDLHLAAEPDARPATDGAIGTLLLEHLASDDPLRPWATRLAASPFDAVLAGALTGSIDLVARVPAVLSAAAGATTTPATPSAVSDVPPADRFVVVDYKTNRLGERGVDATPADYHPARLVDAMAEHHYPLQALLYQVALHRYLRWRLPGYDPDTHLGGVAYLFVRGMVGPATPVVDSTPHGVFSWRPPTSLVDALSELLAGASTRGTNP